MGELVIDQSTSAANIFVGRERELAELMSACESGPDSNTHLFLISGEPGIGKTRLADELAARVKTRGMQVLWGRCWEGDGAPTYWPWIQVIRTYLGALDPELRRIALESEDASDIIQEVAQIVPDLRHAKPAPRPPVNEKLDPNEARFRLFDAVTRFLKIGAGSRPMVIILDDLHDADEASMAMLRFMARELKAAPIIVIGTYRDLEMRRSPGLSKLIGEVSRDGRPIPMSNLRRSEVAKLIEVMARQKPNEALVEKLFQATNGNPLFLDGVVRGLIAEGAIDSAGAVDRQFKIPLGVQEAIRRRLNGISPEANSILKNAAAIGNEFDFDLCRIVAEMSVDKTHLLMDEALRAGIVIPLGQGRYRFSHALIREAIYDELDSNNRVHIHGKIANRLEETYRDNIDPHLAELGHHFREAGVAEKAIQYLMRAGREANSVLAYTDTMAHLQAALDLMEQQGADALPRADLLHWIGKVAFWVDRAASLKFGESAIALYESLGRFAQAAQVRILLGNIFHMRDHPLSNATLASDHLRRAESVIANEPETVSSADLYHIIAANECHKLNVDKTAIAARLAMEISDRLVNKKIWPHAAAFYAWSLCMKGQLREGFALYERAFEITVQAKFRSFPGVWGAGILSRWLGDPRGARRYYERELKRIRKDASPLESNAISGWIDWACFDEGQILNLQQKYGAEEPKIRFWVGGEWEAIADWLETQVELGEKTDDRTHALNECVSAGVANLFIGEHARAEALFSYGLDNADRGSVVLLEVRARPSLARLYVETNRLEQAAEQVARCRKIMAAGEDWRGLAGNVALAEAVVAAERRDYDIGYRLFESALAIHRRYHLAWAEADTLQYWGRALAAAGDRARAAEKFDAAIENHRSRGVGSRFLEWLMADRIRALGTKAPTRVAASPESAAFRKEGEFWTMSYLGATFRLKDIKGLSYIAFLLAHPGERFHARDLTRIVEGAAIGQNLDTSLGDTELRVIGDLDGAAPGLDPRARADYRRRLKELKDEIDEAERFNDIGRATHAREELDFLTAELASAAGIGGRARKSGSHAERARLMVGKNIRTALDKIRSENPGLGRHLSATIRTGYFCSYQPDPDRPVSWQLSAD